ncbi:cache domain-containing protein [Anaeromyxobacter terrae]|uniref:cache domain-containing protein n=1 Tax=Anaeromyxobacter terrae TaxID=2925406 RepID=UPI001F57F1BD|nr:cache domain-containing protein [Anaeromyxobacter sp. SG22]
MRSLPVEVKLALALTVVAVAVAAAGARVTNATIERNVEAAAAVSLRHAAEGFASEEHAELDKLAATLDALLANPELRDAFAARDRRRLLAAAAPIFEVMRERDGITHFYFHLPGEPRTVFLRVHLPELFGDPVERATLRRAEETHELGAGKELGKTAFALRAVRPWIVGGKTIGYVELGQDFERFLRDMKARTGDDFGLLVKKKFLDERAWSAVLGPRQNTWNDRADVVAVDSTAFTDGILDYPGDVETLPEDGVVLGHVERGGRALLRGILPVRDAAGRKVGGLVVLHDFTPQHAALEAGMARLGGAFLGVALAGGAAVFALVHLLVFRRLGRLRRSLEARGAGLPAGASRLRSADELGRLEALFERLGPPGPGEGQARPRTPER